MFFENEEFLAWSTEKKLKFSHDFLSSISAASASACGLGAHDHVFRPTSASPQLVVVRGVVADVWGSEIFARAEAFTDAALDAPPSAANAASRLAARFRRFPGLSPWLLGLQQEEKDDKEEKEDEGGEPSFCALFYDTGDGGAAPAAPLLRLSSPLELFGLLLPPLSPDDGGGGDDGDGDGAKADELNELTLSVPPAQLRLPRLHVLAARALPSRLELAFPRFRAQPPEFSVFPALRRALLAHFRRHLGKELAEWALLAAFGRRRRALALPCGGEDEGEALARWARAARALLPAVVHVPHVRAPIFDIDEPGGAAGGALQGGCLRLARAAAPLALLDARSLRSPPPSPLIRLMRDGVCEHRCGFHTVEAPTDAAVVICGEEKALTALLDEIEDLTVLPRPRALDPEKKGEEGGDDDETPTTPFADFWGSSRLAVARAHAADCVLSAAAQARAEADFVRWRREDARFGAGDLRRLLAWSEAMALSMGKTEVDEEAWERTKALEFERKMHIARQEKEEKK